MNEPQTSASPRTPERKAPRDVLRFAVAVMLVATGAAGFAIAFRSALAFPLWQLARAHNVVEAMRAVPLWLRLVLPAIGGLLAGAIGLIVARSSQGHGVGDVMEAVVLGRVRLSLRVTLLKSLASWLAIAFGGSLGREGPLIQWGGALGKAVSDRFGLPLEDARRLIAAGTAAGFAAAYNTPFAAVLFVLEIVTGIIVIDTVVPALVATVLAAQITRLILGEGPLYGQRAFELRSPLELLAYAALGLVGALAAQLFMRLLSRGEHLFARLLLPWRPALGGLFAGAIIAVLPDVSGNGYEPLNEMLGGRYTGAFVLGLLLAKTVATTASVSSGSPGGVFTPILLVGGSVGYLFGLALSASFGAAAGPAGGYALVGMAATTAASTHAPLMAAVMVFELSGDYAIVLPLSLATAVATAVSRALRKDSIYTAELAARGVAWELTLEGRKIERAALHIPHGDE